MLPSEYSQKANDPQRHCHTSGSAALRGLNPTTLVMEFPTMAKTTKTVTVTRSSVSGRFVPKANATQNPRETETEHYTPKKPTKKK